MVGKDVTRPLGGDAPLRVMCDFEGRQLVPQILSANFVTHYSPQQSLLFSQEAFWPSVAAFERPADAL